MLARVSKFTPCRGTFLARSFGGGPVYDPTFERDWTTPNNQKLYSRFLVGYDAGEGRKDSMQSHRWTIQSFLSKALPQNAQRYMTDAFRENCDTRKAERQVADSYRPPKIHENSILVYHGSQLANLNVNFRWYDPIMLFCPWIFHPGMIPPMMMQAGIYFWYLRAGVYEMGRRLVLRMDLLPHIESVSILKVGTWGGIYNEIVRVQDLEKVDRQSDYDKTNAMYEWNMTHMDWDMSFRNKVSGEIYVFEELGMWDYNGVNHPLLV